MDVLPYKSSSRSRVWKLSKEVHFAKYYTIYSYLTKSVSFNYLIYAEIKLLWNMTASV